MNQSLSETLTHCWSVNRAYAGLRVGWEERAEYVELRMADKMWKYASVASTKTKTIVSIGANAVCFASGREIAGIAGGELSGSSTAS